MGDIKLDSEKAKAFSRGVSDGPSFLDKVKAAATGGDAFEIQKRRRQLAEKIQGQMDKSSAATGPTGQRK